MGGGTTSAKACFMSSLPHCAFISCASFGRNRMSLASRIRRQEAVSFADRSRKKYVWIAVSFVTDCSYLCGVNF